MRYTIASVGELLWDLLPGGRQPGGAPGNYACHAKALGCDAIVVSRVGDDAAGRELLGRLGESGVDCRYITLDPAHPTGASTVEVDRHGVPAFVVHENAAWDFIEFTPELERLARRVDAVYFGTLPQRSEVSRGTVASFVGATRPGTIRVFDANFRHPYFSRSVVESSLRMATVLKLNDDELSVMSEFFGLDGDAPSRLRRLASGFGLHAVALTRGAGGSVVVAGERISIHAGYRARVVDTVGAGDAFAAVLTVGLLDGDDIGRTADHANRVAAFVCERAGATPLVPPEILRGPAD